MTLQEVAAFAAILAAAVFLVVHWRRRKACRSCAPSSARDRDRGRLHLPIIE